MPPPQRRTAHRGTRMLSAACSLTTCPPDCPALHVRGRTTVTDGAAPRSAQRPVDGLRSVHSRSLMPACGVTLAHPRAPRMRTARDDARSGTTATLRHFLLDTRASRPRLQHARAYPTACTLTALRQAAQSLCALRCRRCVRCLRVTYVGANPLGGAFGCLRGFSDPLD